MRPIAGNLDVGQRFLESVRPVVLRAWDREAVVRSIESMLDETRQNRPLGSSSLVDVKTDAGGLRSVEFLVQGLQLMHARKAPGLLTGNTLEALEVLEGAGLLPADVCRQLGEDYLFLRRVEHGLQLFEDRQVHAVPADRDELTALSRRILGVEATADAFIERLNACMGRVRDAYAHWLLAES
jgi:glutamate-ammonia-ligase adenylyltransferase